MIRDRTQRKAWLFIAGVLLVSLIGLAAAYVYQRNRLPHFLTRRLAQIKAQGHPVTLIECDRQYRALGSAPEAVRHFQRAFEAMAKEAPPLVAPQENAHPEVRPALPKLSRMKSPEGQAEVASCLASNAAALRLLHEGKAYERTVDSSWAGSV
jgi:hypothetical protein